MIIQSTGSGFSLRLTAPAMTSKLLGVTINNQTESDPQPEYEWKNDGEGVFQGVSEMHFYQQKNKCNPVRTPPGYI